MGHGYKHGASGKKENPLNFEVVAYPSDVELNTATPEVFTIGVVTTNPITGWYFTATQPENMVEGEVWFATGTSSDVAFNALKKNDVHVYPVKATQYVNSELKEVTAKIYQDREWRLLVNETYLYKNGTFADAEGGLKQVGVSYDGKQPGQCVITTNESYVTIGSMVGLAALAYFPKKYDLTDFKTLYFNGSFVDSDPEYSGKYSIGVWKTIPTSDARVEASAIMDGKMEEDTYALDVSSCTGEHYVGIVIFGYGPEANPSSVVTMNQMYLK